MAEIYHTTRRRTRDLPQAFFCARYINCGRGIKPNARNTAIPRRGIRMPSAYSSYSNRYPNRPILPVSIRFNADSLITDVVEKGRWQELGSLVRREASLPKSASCETLLSSITWGTVIWLPFRWHDI